MKLKSIVTLFVFLASCVIVIAIANELSGLGNYYEDFTYEEARMTVEEQEKATPATFMTSDGTYRRNLIDQWVLEGTISNTATIANYKDAVLTVSYYSKTQTLLGTEQFVVYEYFEKGKTKEFKLKTNGYKGAESVGWEVTDASVIN